jgi:hypothetical protein
LFTEGTYNKKTGTTDYKLTSQPMWKEWLIYKAKQDPLFFWIYSLDYLYSFLWFLLFWMFLPQTTIFKRMYFTVAGIVLTIVCFLLMAIQINYKSEKYIFLQDGFHLIIKMTFKHHRPLILFYPHLPQLHFLHNVLAS